MAYGLDLFWGEEGAFFGLPTDRLKAGGGECVNQAIVFGMVGALPKPLRLQPESVGQVGLILTSRLLQGLFINFLFQRSRK